MDSKSVESFLLVQNSSKRSAEDVIGDISMKRARIEEEKCKQSIDKIASAKKSKKRKLSDLFDVDNPNDEQNQREMNRLLALPSREEAEKEKGLDLKDREIRMDRKKFKNLRKKWRKDEKKREKFMAQQEQDKEKSKEMQKKLNCLAMDKLKEMTHENLEYLENIYNGKELSEKHRLYKLNIAKTMQHLFYTTINEPFNEEQSDLVYNIVYDHFIKKSEIEHNYIQWVIHSEALIKIFMDFFCIHDKDEALKDIQNCPVDEDILSEEELNKSEEEQDQEEDPSLNLEKNKDSDQISVFGEIL